MPKYIANKFSLSFQGRIPPKLYTSLFINFLFQNNIWHTEQILYDYTNPWLWSVLYIVLLVVTLEIKNMIKFYFIYNM